jgi:DNA adenine methylase
MIAPTRPIVRYHGGKWMLGPWIISHFPEHRVYTECFGGGGSVLLRKPRSYAEVYNDMDGEMVNLFRVARDNSRELFRRLRLTPFSRDVYREAFELSEDPIEMALRTVIRSYMGFGSNSINRNVKSGFRANSNRSGTTPAHDWVNYPRIVPAIANRMRGVVIENKPAADVMLTHDSATTLHYVDPPYVWGTRALDIMHGDHGYAHEMTDEQHRELAATLTSLKGMVILSGYPSPLYDELYGDWHCEQREALADGAAKRTECLWINAAAMAHTAGLFT